MIGITPNWIEYEQRVDSMVDGLLGELVELHPWTNEGYPTGGGPDGSRKVLAGPTVVGMYVRPGSKIVGEGSSGFAGADTQVLEEEVWLSIQSSILGPVTNWVPMDRVFFPYRNEWYQIVYIGDSATNRPNVHLNRLQDADLSATMVYAKSLPIRPRRRAPFRRRR